MPVSEDHVGKLIEETCSEIGIELGDSDKIAAIRLFLIAGVSWKKDPNASIIDISSKMAEETNRTVAKSVEKVVLEAWTKVYTE